MSKYIVKLYSKFIATKWWSQKWCNNISQYADFYNRLERGKTYLRRGMVKELVIEGGKITASVAGSAEIPYQVTITIKPLSDEKVKEALKNLHHINDLQYGRVSIDEKYIFSMDKNGLFPAIDEIGFSCTCPDWASLCKHCAAVLYAVGSILDQEPLVLFQLRGIDIDAYLETSLLEKTNILLSKIYNAHDKTIDQNMISDIFGIELGSLPDNLDVDGEIDNTPKITDITRIIEIKPSESVASIDAINSAIRQYNLDGVFVQQFESYEEAAKNTSIPKRAIKDACDGRREITGEYQWRIADFNDAKINIPKYIPRIDYSLLTDCPIQQLDLNGNLIAEFNSAAQAAQKKNISISWLRDALSGRQAQAGGFIWKLLPEHERKPSSNQIYENQQQSHDTLESKISSRGVSTVKSSLAKEMFHEELQRRLKIAREKAIQKELLNKQEEVKPSSEIVSDNQKQNNIKKEEKNCLHQKFKAKAESGEKLSQVEKDMQAQIAKEKAKQKDILRKQEERKRLEEARKRQEKIDIQRASYRKQGLCQYCGGAFKKKFFFFSSNICSRCGRKKDY